MKKWCIAERLFWWSFQPLGAYIADVWLQPGKMPVVDSLGEDFLAYVKDGMSVTIGPDGLVTVE